MPALEFSERYRSTQYVLYAGLGMKYAFVSFALSDITFVLQKRLKGNL